MSSSDWCRVVSALNQTLLQQTVKTAIASRWFHIAKPHPQTRLAFSARRPRVDKKDPPGSVLALRLAHDLEPGGGTNLRASLRPSELLPLAQGPILLSGITARIFFILFHMYFVHLFITLFWYLKSANKSLWLYVQALISSRVQPTKCVEKVFPSPAAVLNKYFTEVKQFGVKLYRFLYFPSF